MIENYGKNALQTGLNVATYVVECTNCRDSLKKRVPYGIRGFQQTNSVSLVEASEEDEHNLKNLRNV